MRILTGRKFLVILSVTCVAAMHSADARAGNLIDLGAATAHAINNAGNVALDQGIYTNGTITPLPPLPGGSQPAAALAINASGQVAGSAPPAGTSPIHPIAYINGSLIPLVPDPTGVNGMNPGEATGINDNNEVVAWYVINQRDDIFGAFTYSNGVATTVPDFPCRSFNSRCTLLHGPDAHGINSSGQLTGSIWYEVEPGTTDSCMGLYGDAYIYSNGTWTDLGVGTGYAINSQGDATGDLTPIVNNPSDCRFQSPHAFLYKNGVKTDLGTLPGGQKSYGYAINAADRIVGQSDFAGSSSTHAFYYNGVMTDLNALVSAADPLKPFVTLTDAQGINDSRLIAANGIDSRTGLAHAYLVQGSWIDITPGTLNFAGVAVGSTGAQQSVTLTNSGAAAVSLSIAPSTNFLATNNCGAALAAGAQCTVMTSFAPTLAGALAGGLTVTADGVNYVVPVSGIAPVAATLTASAATLDVGETLTLAWTLSPGATCTAVGGSSSFNEKTLQASGQMTLTEAGPGNISYQIHCTAAGTPEVDTSTSVTWSWPDVTATLSASPGTIAEGGSTTLTWASTNATSCTGTGGNSGDGWAGAKATSGSQSVPEPFKLATSSATVTYGITCTSSQSNLSAQASADLTVNDPPSSSGGGGAFDLSALLALMGIWTLTAQRTRSRA